jgi:hypothetical protein
MSAGNTNTYGNKGHNYPYQISVLQLLEAIQQAIIGIPIGTDYETRTTFYEATAAGPGYFIGDILVRYDIINTPGGTVATTVWFNQTLQTTIAAPAPANIIPWAPPSTITVSNPFNLEATQILVKDLLTTIDADTSNLDVALSTVAREATLTALNGLVATAANQTTEIARLTSILGQLDVALSTRNAEATQLAIQALLTTIDGDTSNLDVALSTRASEATAALIKAKTDNLDVALSTRASEATLALIKAKTDNLDVLLSTRASEVTLSSINTILGNTLDVLLSSRASEATLATRASEATASLIKAKTDNLDVLLSTRASEATLSTLLTLSGFNTRINTLGQKTMANSTPVVLPSDQSPIPITLPTGASRTPSVVLIPAASAGNTTAGVKQLSMRVSGGNATIGGTAVPNGTVLTFSADQYNDTVGSIAYTTGAGTTILISYLT